jgi:hypothetical protein
MKVDDSRIFVVHGGRTKHGPRQHWREIEYAQVAMQTVFPEKRWRSANQKVLHWKINEWLREDPEYQKTGFGEVSLRTVLRARRLLLAKPS